MAASTELPLSSSASGAPVIAVTVAPPPPPQPTWFKIYVDQATICSAAAFSLGILITVELKRSQTPWNPSRINAALAFAVLSNMSNGLAFLISLAGYATTSTNDDHNDQGNDDEGSNKRTCRCSLFDLFFFGFVFESLTFLPYGSEHCSGCPLTLGSKLALGSITAGILGEIFVCQCRE